MLRKVFYLLAGMMMAAGLATVIDIIVYSRKSSQGPADAAMVLGAAVIETVPSPVFEERIRHAVELYKSGRVRYLAMTGGVGEGDAISEGEAARNWALSRGVSHSAILIETHSTTTQENLTMAMPLLKKHGIERILLVSDPLHMRRSVALARQLGLEAVPAPTPTTRYTGWRSWLWFLFGETYYITRCRVSSTC